jgi:hypothetical protein
MMPEKWELWANEIDRALRGNSCHPHTTQWLVGESWHPAHAAFSPGIFAPTKRASIPFTPCSSLPGFDLPFYTLTLSPLPLLSSKLLALNITCYIMLEFIDGD